MSWASSTQTEQLSVWGTKAEQRARVGRPQLVEAPSNFIAGRPIAAFLLRFFGVFRCGVMLLIVILVMFKNIEIGKINVKC